MTCTCRDEVSPACLRHGHLIGEELLWSDIEWCLRQALARFGKPGWTTSKARTVGAVWEKECSILAGLLFNPLS